MYKSSPSYSPDFKLKVVQAYYASGKTQPDICREFSISRSSLCKWIKGYQQKGLEGLINHPTTPKRPARQTAKKIIDQVADLKQKEPHKYQGLRSFSDYLKRFQGISLSLTTLSKIFKKRGIPLGEENYQAQIAQVNPKKAEIIEKQVLSELNQWERFERATPGDLWQMDITSFYIKNEGKVYLIDVLDDHSRFIIGWGLFREQTSENVLKVLTESINRHGAPKELLTDNGRQFTNWNGTTAFEVFLDQHQIQHIKSRPHHPQTLGKLERLHGTIKKELIEVKYFHSLPEAREEIRKYVDYYNYHRTHSALDGLVPADRYFGVKTPISPKPADLYLAGKIAGKNIRIQKSEQTVDLYHENDLVYQISWDEVTSLWNQLFTPHPQS